MDQGGLDVALRNLLQGKSIHCSFQMSHQLPHSFHTRELLVQLLLANKSNDKLKVLFYLHLLKFRGSESAEQNQLCLEVVLSLLSDVNSQLKFKDCRLLLQRLLEREKMQKLDKDKSYSKGVSRFLQILQDRPQHLSQLLDHFSSKKFRLAEGSLREIR